MVCKHGRLFDVPCKKKERKKYQTTAQNWIVRKFAPLTSCCFFIQHFVFILWFFYFAFSYHDQFKNGPKIKYEFEHYDFEFFFFFFCYIVSMNCRCLGFFIILSYSVNRVLFISFVVNFALLSCSLAHSFIHSVTFWLIILFSLFICIESNRRTYICTRRAICIYHTLMFKQRIQKKKQNKKKRLLLFK